MITNTTSETDRLERAFREFHDQPEWDEYPDPDIQPHDDGIEVTNAWKALPRPVTLTMNSLGWKWYYKPDNRFKDGKNPRRVVITAAPE